jgi:hypothetical protein
MDFRGATTATDADRLNFFPLLGALSQSRCRSDKGCRMVRSQKSQQQHREAKLPYCGRPYAMLGERESFTTCSRFMPRDPVCT